MNKKEHKEFKRGWALGIAGLIVAFFAGIAANGAYDYLHDHYNISSAVIFLFFGALTIVAISYLSFFIENIEKLRDEKDSKILVLWIKNIFKRSKDKAKK
ncbi:MAG: hypothetical protein WC823_02885 [Parcubacteria group bacterium]|jgi:multisubunit Na+/H+ antiporter MnhB subunit